MLYSNVFFSDHLLTSVIKLYTYISHLQLQLNSGTIDVTNGY